MGASVWVLTLIEHTWEDDIHNVLLYKSLEGVQGFLREHWNKWRYKADMDDGFGPNCPSLQDLESLTMPKNFFTQFTDDEIIVADFGGDYHYSILVKIQLKYVND